MTIFYDAGVLIAADRNQRSVWAEHRARLELGVVPITTAPVVAQVGRSTQQTSLHRLLNGCSTIGFEPVDAPAVGQLCAAAKTADVVDAHLVHAAAKSASLILTGDIDDLGHLAGLVSPAVSVIPVEA